VPFLEHTHEVFDDIGRVVGRLQETRMLLQDRFIDVSVYFVPKILSPFRMSVFHASLLCPAEDGYIEDQLNTQLQIFFLISECRRNICTSVAAQVHMSASYYG